MTKIVAPTEVESALKSNGAHIAEALRMFESNPSERNECYVTGYIAGCEYSNSIGAHHAHVLTQHVARVAHNAKQAAHAPNEGERSLYKWQCGALGSFERHIWTAISVADSGNLDALERAFPEHVKAYRRYVWESGYWEQLRARIEK
jgi:hypothetical protein